VFNSGGNKMPRGIGADNNNGESPVTFKMIIGAASNGMHKILGEGDIMLVYNTMDDLKNETEVRSAFPLWMFNDGCNKRSERSYEMSVQRAAAIQREVSGGGMKRSYQAVSADNTGENSSFDIYPLRSEEYRRLWEIAGVVARENKTSQFDPKFKAGYNPNLDRLFRLTTMISSSECTMPYLSSEQPYRSMSTYMIGSCGNMNFGASTDSRGRKIVACTTKPIFQMRFHVAKHGMPPSELEHSYNVEETVIMRMEKYDPVTGHEIPGHSQIPIETRFTTTDFPVIIDWGKVKRFESSVPSNTEVEAAYISSADYRSLFARSKVTLDLKNKEIDH